MNTTGNNDTYCDLIKRLVELRNLYKSMPEDKRHDDVVGSPVLDAIRYIHGRLEIMDSNVVYYTKEVKFDITKPKTE